MELIKAKEFDHSHPILRGLFAASRTRLRSELDRDLRSAIDAFASKYPEIVRIQFGNKERMIEMGIVNDAITSTHSPEVAPVPMEATWGEKETERSSPAGTTQPQVINLGFGPMSVLDLTDDAYKAIVPGTQPSLDAYAKRIAAMVTNTDPWESAGLYAREHEIQEIGREINSRGGFEAMQYVWKTVQSLKGPGATSELTRIWDGIGKWRS